VEPCLSCHADKKPHAGTVACQTCHVNIAGGHHTFGNVGATLCTSCHTDVQIHASGTTPGASFTCTTCHEGSVHGEFSRPARAVCIACHDRAEEHSGGNDCIACHWKAAHTALPDAAQQSGFEKMPVTLPVEPTTTSTSTPGGGAPPERPNLGNTGVQMEFLGAFALLLLAVGIPMRRGSAKPQ